jgi:hypothetical protein
LLKIDNSSQGFTASASLSPGGLTVSFGGRVVDELEKISFKEGLVEMSSDDDPYTFGKDAVAKEREWVKACKAIANDVDGGMSQTRFT